MTSAATAVRPRKGSRKAALVIVVMPRANCLSAQIVSRVPNDISCEDLRLTSVGKIESILWVRFEESSRPPSLVFRAVGQVSRSLFVAILPACEKRAKNLNGVSRRVASAQRDGIVLVQRPLRVELTGDGRLDELVVTLD